MPAQSNWAAIAIVVFAMSLPFTYVASYAAMVLPDAAVKHGRCGDITFTHYRVDHLRVEQIFWPLEQVDRRVRPAAWMEPITVFDLDLGSW